jgi:hypothetical protein
MEALVGSQELLGVIHSETRARAADLDEVRRSLRAGPSPPVIEHGPEALRAEMEAWTTLSQSVTSEVDSVAAAMDVTISFQALTFHDACPPNRIVTAAGVRALDLEIAGFRHPMSDGAYAAIGHLRCMVRRGRPGDGLAIPSSARELATDAYRRAVLASFPEYEDEDRFDDDLVAAGAIWMIYILSRMRPKVAGNRPRGFLGVTACQRVLATLAAFSELAASRGRLLALVAWAEGLHVQLVSDWPSLPPLSVSAGLRP